MRKVFIYIGVSLDGYIAKPGDDLSFLNISEKEGEDYGYAEFIADIDTYIIGRRTYDWVVNNVGIQHYEKGSRTLYVVSRYDMQDREKIKFFKGTPSELVRQLKSQPGKNIYCDGGAEVIDDLLKNGLIDEMVISNLPILVGDGIRLFKDGRPEQLLELAGVKSYDTGLVQLHYKRVRLKHYPTHDRNHNHHPH